MNSWRLLAYHVLCELFSCYLLGSSKSGNDIGEQGMSVKTVITVVTVMLTVFTVHLLCSGHAEYYMYSNI